MIKENYPELLQILEDIFKGTEERYRATGKYCFVELTLMDGSKEEASVHAWGYKEDEDEESWPSLVFIHRDGSLSEYTADEVKSYRFLD